MPSYRGTCHCGRNQFKLETPTIGAAFDCGCKLCIKKGMLWVEYSLETEALRRDILSGFHEELGDIVTFSSPSIHYTFCACCGTGLEGRHTTGKLAGLRLVNVRTLVDLNPFLVNAQRLDDQRQMKPSIGSLEDANDSVLLTGSCCCQAIRYQVRGSPLAAREIKEDNCSICTRNAFIGIYPSKAEVKIDAAEDVVKVYSFGRGFNGHAFCSACGVPTHQVLFGPPQVVIDRLPPERLAFVRKQLDVQPVNVRCMDNVELSQLTISREDEGQTGYSAPTSKSTS